MMVQVNDKLFSDLLNMSANYEMMMYMNLAGGILIGLAIMKLYAMVKAR